MKVSIKEAWKLVEKTLGPDIKSIEIEIRRGYKDELTINWKVRLVDYSTFESEYLHEAIINAKAHVDVKSKEPVEDVVVETEEESKVDKDLSVETKNNSDDIPF